MIEGSVTKWIGQLKLGNAEAARLLWNRYAQNLILLAQQKMMDAPKTAGDEEDVAQSVFGSICRGAAAGRFEQVTSRDDLWWLLLAVTKQKVVDHTRRETAQKRGDGRVQLESGLCGQSESSPGITLDDLVGDVPTPDMLVMLDEQHQRLLSLLRDDRLRKIAMARIEGYTVAEIAAELSISTRAVERKLQLIRATWATELSNPE